MLQWLGISMKIWLQLRLRWLWANAGWRLILQDSGMPYNCVKRGTSGGSTWEPLSIANLPLLLLTWIPQKQFTWNALFNRVKLAISNFRYCEFNFVDKSCNNAPLVLADLGCKNCATEIWLLDNFVKCNINPAAFIYIYIYTHNYILIFVFPM